MTFIKTPENFVCEKCGTEVLGDGYTNHCPNCLWSKHVDIDPGDRESICFGMMEPISVTKKGEEYIILHKCTVCGLEKPNKSVKTDNFDTIVKISSNPKK